MLGVGINSFLDLFNLLLRVGMFLLHVVKHVVRVIHDCRIVGGMGDAAGMDACRVLFDRFEYLAVLVVSLHKPQRERRLKG